MKLSEYTSPLSYDVAFWMAGIKNPSYPLDQLGALCTEVSEKLRTLAIIVLLTQGNSDSFYHNLVRSGISREIYLRRCRDSSFLNDHYLAASRYEPLLDAMVANDFELARRIASLAPLQWMQGHEYEEDYCWARILHTLLLGDHDFDTLGEVIARYQAVLDGAVTARVVIADALKKRNQSDFDTAFEALLRERERWIQANIARGQLETPRVIAERQVFVEGLALLRLAEANGLRAQSEYLFCPSIARRPMKNPFPGE